MFSVKRDILFLQYQQKEDDYNFHKLMLKSKKKNELDRAENPLIERQFLETETLVTFNSPNNLVPP